MSNSWPCAVVHSLVTPGHVWPSCQLKGNLMVLYIEKYVANLKVS